MPDDAGPMNTPDEAQPAPAPGGASVPPPQTPAPVGGGGMPPPVSGGMGLPIQALGKIAEARNKAKAIVTVMQRDLMGAFEFNSPEGKAIHKALGALGPVFGGSEEEQKNKNSAMMALRQRAMAQKGMGGGAPGGAPPGGASPMPQPNRGPIPAMGGGMPG